MKNLHAIFIGLLLVLEFTISAQTAKERPFIWVTNADKAAILTKIETQDWAKKEYQKFITNLDNDIALHSKDADKFIKGMPFEWEKAKDGAMPPFYKTYHIENGIQNNLDNTTEEEWVNGKRLLKYLQMGVDCGIAYYLTNDARYAQCGTDILNAFVKGVLQSEVSTWKGRGGWLFPYDGFREVRDYGVKVPIMYDFLASYIKNGGQPYDIIEKKKVDFSIADAQKVFRQYADITINYGHTGSNHPVLEAPSLVYNALAMEDAKERDKLLSYFLTENTENQDALTVMADTYKSEGDIWPETSQYFNGVSTILARLMLVVNKYDPTLRLGNKYPNILFSLPKLDYLVYPNNEIVRWGDGKRHGGPSFSSYEDAYLLGQMDGNTRITDKFGPLLKRAVSEGKYQRKGIEAVLFHGADLPTKMNEFALPRTDKVDHAGIFLQRNISTTGKPQDGLMCFVGGAAMVHGHAEGMNIELYGKGEVLGVDNGRGSYQKDIHENYSRIYAAHNTVIVNGSSRGEDGWSNLGINTVKLISMEPMPNVEALSPNYSFSHTSFEDDKGDKAEAHQERTLALVRTSPATGYYVDVFRSKSALPNEYHDYLYHNIGDKLKVLNKDIAFSADPNRYMANANGEWKQNNAFRHPGWHFFKEVNTSGDYVKDVKAVFPTGKIKGKSIFMGLHIPGFANRTYTKVMAPLTFEAPSPYDELPTPTLVIRNQGAAWENPFVVVYEPYADNEANSSIVTVNKLTQNGAYRGLKICSKVGGKAITQYVITQLEGDVFEDKKLGIYFSGSFGIITLDNKGKVSDLYIGNGKQIKYKKTSIITEKNSQSAYRKY